ncbi:MAG TPA: hypothetical protein VEQ84_10190 [Vicinamibacteria bacterium]|nr:hypothetical protein [Vicinamibacteria bacterium]
MTRKGRRAIVIATGAVVALAAVFVLDTLYVAGSFKRLSPHGNGACKSVAIAGVEDMALLDEGHAFLSSDDRRARQAGRPTPGAIWLYDVSGATAPRNLTPAATTTFRPHGIGYWSIGPGRGRLRGQSPRRGDGEGGASSRHRNLRLAGGRTRPRGDGDGRRAVQSQ